MAQEKLLLNAATATGESSVLRGLLDMDRSTENRMYQIWGTTTAGAGAATVIVKGRQHPSAPWETLGTMSLVLGTAVTSDFVGVDTAWQYQCVDMTAISGTGATVYCALGGV